jgi:hypothetical protein
MNLRGRLPLAKEWMLLVTGDSGNEARRSLAAAQGNATQIDQAGFDYSAPAVPNLNKTCAAN